MSEAGVAFNDLRYRLPDGRELLRGVTVELTAGSITALLGRSGSGKTTLLRMVNRLVEPTGGTVWVNGRRTSEYDLIELRRSIGYVIQETGLFPHLTVERNVGMALELAGRPAKERAQQTEEMLRLTGLSRGEFGSRYPWQLSGGQRQRVGLARALATDPEVLLMDEPFGALDPITRAEMQLMLQDLLRRVRKTVLMVTHDLDEAMFLADRLLFVSDGSLIADLQPSEIAGSTLPGVQEYLQAVHRGRAA